MLRRVICTIYPKINLKALQVLPHRVLFSPRVFFCAVAGAADEPKPEKKRKSAQEVKEIKISRNIYMRRTKVRPVLPTPGFSESDEEDILDEPVTLELELKYWQFVESEGKWHTGSVQTLKNKHGEDTPGINFSCQQIDRILRHYHDSRYTQEDKDALLKSVFETAPLVDNDASPEEADDDDNVPVGSDPKKLMMAVHKIGNKYLSGSLNVNDLYERLKTVSTGTTYSGYYMLHALLRTTQADKKDMAIPEVAEKVAMMEQLFNSLDQDTEEQRSYRPLVSRTGTLSVTQLGESVSSTYPRPLFKHLSSITESALKYHKQI